jgi:predicted transcriptional regulator
MRTAVTITLPESTLAALDGYAAARNVPRSYAAQELLERLLLARIAAKPAQEPTTTAGHTAV